MYFFSFTNQRAYIFVVHMYVRLIRVDFSFYINFIALFLFCCCNRHRYFMRMCARKQKYFFCMPFDDECVNDWLLYFNILYNCHNIVQMHANDHNNDDPCVSILKYFDQTFTHKYLNPIHWRIFYACVALTTSNKIISNDQRHSLPA